MSAGLSLWGKHVTQFRGPRLFRRFLGRAQEWRAEASLVSDLPSHTAIREATLGASQAQACLEALGDSHEQPPADALACVAQAHPKSLGFQDLQFLSTLQETGFRTWVVWVVG